MSDFINLSIVLEDSLIAINGETITEGHGFCREHGWHASVEDGTCPVCGDMLTTKTNSDDPCDVQVTDPQTPGYYGFV